MAADVIDTRVHGRKVPARIDERFHIGSDTASVIRTDVGTVAYPICPEEDLPSEDTKGK